MEEKISDLVTKDNDQSNSFLCIIFDKCNIKLEVSICNKNPNEHYLIFSNSTLGIAYKSTAVENYSIDLLTENTSNTEPRLFLHNLAKLDTYLQCFIHSARIITLSFTLYNNNISTSMIYDLEYNEEETNNITITNKKPNKKKK